MNDTDRIILPTKPVATHENQKLENKAHFELPFGYTASKMCSFNTSSEMPHKRFVNETEITNIVHPYLYKDVDILYDDPNSSMAKNTYVDVNKIQIININDIANASDFGQLTNGTMLELLENYVFAQDTNLTLERNDIRTSEVFNALGIDINQLRKGKNYQLNIERLSDEWTKPDLQEWLEYREWFTEQYNVPQIIDYNRNQDLLMQQIAYTFTNQEGYSQNDIVKMEQYFELVRGNMQVIGYENEKGIGKVA